MKRKKGTLTIPSLNISVPLYEGDNTQAIVDDSDSAVWFRLGVQDCIADHCHQGGFSRIKDAKPGKTTAWVTTSAGKTLYTCTRSETGRLVNESGKHYLRDAYMQPVHKQNAGGLCIYTCTGKSDKEITYVYLTYWRKEALSSIKSTMKK